MLELSINKCFTIPLLQHRERRKKNRTATIPARNDKLPAEQGKRHGQAQAPQPPPEPGPGRSGRHPGQLARVQLQNGHQRKQQRQCQRTRIFTVKLFVQLHTGWSRPKFCCC